MTEELKPCSWCKEIPDSDLEWSQCGRTSYESQVSCECGVVGPFGGGETHKEAIQAAFDAWNDRIETSQ